MKPWDILGWLLVAVVSIPIALIVFGSVFGLWKLLLTFLADRLKHFMTRNIPPQEGQVWKQNGGRFGGNLTITKVHDDGSVSMRSGNVSWGDSAKSWKERVKNRKLILISQPKKDS